MAMVAFRCYISEDGVDQIRLWFDGQADDVQAALLAVLEIMEATSRKRWAESYFKALEKRKAADCEGLDELVLVIDGVHYRIFGFSGPGTDDFTMLLPLKKKEDPTYKVSCPEAQKRKEEVLNDWGRTCEWQPPE
jgi:Phage derived protein Gp49-like (DUF891)